MTKMCLWSHPGNDVTGMVGRCEKVVGTCEKVCTILKLLVLFFIAAVVSTKVNSS